MAPGGTCCSGPWEPVTPRFAPFQEGDHRIPVCCNLVPARGVAGPLSETENSCERNSRSITCLKHRKPRGDWSSQILGCIRAAATEPAGAGKPAGRGGGGSGEAPAASAGTCPALLARIQRKAPPRPKLRDGGRSARDSLRTDAPPPYPSPECGDAGKA